MQEAKRICDSLYSVNASGTVIISVESCVTHEISTHTAEHVPFCVIIETQIETFPFFFHLAGKILFHIFSKTLNMPMSKDKYQN